MAPNAPPINGIIEYPPAAGFFRRRRVASAIPPNWQIVTRADAAIKLTAIVHQVRVKRTGPLV